MHSWVLCALVGLIVLSATAQPLLLGTQSLPPLPEDVIISLEAISEPAPTTERSETSAFSLRCPQQQPPPAQNVTLAAALGPIRHVNITTTTDNNTTTSSNIAYLRFGNASSSARPPLLYLLGLGSTLASMPLDMVQSLSKDQEVIIFDH